VRQGFRAVIETQDRVRRGKGEAMIRACREAVGRKGCADAGRQPRLWTRFGAGTVALAARVADCDIGG